MATSVQSLIVAAAQAAGLSPQLALAVANQESGFNQGARGAAGEIGVFQLMPATAASLGVNPTDLSQNIQGGVAYLALQLSTFADPWQAVAAYNCGPACVQNAIAAGGANWFAYVPASTRSYVIAVVGSAPPTSSVTAASAAPVPVTNVPAPQPIDSADLSASSAGPDLSALFLAPSGGFSAWAPVAGIATLVAAAFLFS